MNVKHHTSYLHIGIVAVFLSWTSTSFAARSPFRPIDTTLPIITVCSSCDQTPYTLSDSHLEEYAIFKLFDRDYFYSHLLTDTVSYRNKEKELQGQEISKLIEHTLQEIIAKEKEFTYCDILQDRDFNRRKSCGLIVLKFKEHPFVIKLFIENPQSFANPQCKGIIPSCLFYMGGGVNRHTTGFTRLRNAEYIRRIVSENPQWKDKIDIPRKWFWLPTKPEWLEVCGRNIGGKDTLTTSIPAVYAIVADAIDCERSFALHNTEDREIALELCNLFNLAIDPHITNFMINKETKNIAIIDTEHFPTIVGLKESYVFNGYLGWYFHLTKKCVEDMLLRTKNTRSKIQLQGCPPSYAHLLSLNQPTHAPCA